MRTLLLFPTDTATPAGPPPVAPDLATYSRFPVMFSGGKDSLACVLHLLESGVPRESIELWHHDVDGREGSTLMDWPSTRGYCEAVAAHLGIPLLYSWKVGGFEREMMKADARTAAISWQEPGGITRTKGGTRGKLSTRRKFPQKSGNLSVRWCSAYLKVDVADRALRNDPRFSDSRTLVLTGERAEESPGRAKYHTFEPHRADLRAGRAGRHIDHWRPVLRWTEAEVWAIIERWSIVPHPAYRAGWGRVSCRACIFGSPSQWASLRAVDPAGFARIGELEQDFSCQIDRKGRGVAEIADTADPYPDALGVAGVEAMDPHWSHEITTDTWTAPAGAYGDLAGPC